MGNIEFAWPVFFIQMLVLFCLGLCIFTLRQLSKKEMGKQSKLKWVLIIILLPIIGPLLFLRSI